MRLFRKFPVIVIILLILMLRPGYTREVPDWAVNPADFQNSVNLTAQLFVDYVSSTNPADQIAAFVGEECRGVVTSATMGEQQLFFLTAYSNINAENMSLKAYISDLDSIVMLNESLEFVVGVEYGNPLDPVELNAIILFDHPPLVSGLQDQTIEIGGSFSTLNLDNYLTELDGDEVTWNNSETEHIEVALDTENVATFTVLHTGWVGSETIRFTATDVTESTLVGEDSLTLTVLPEDHPPELTSIPNQTIGQGGTFAPIQLESYLTEEDGDTISWSMVFEERSETHPLPGWSFEPSNFSSTMNITATVRTRGKPIRSDNYSLAVFVGDECRGVVNPQFFNESGIFFLTAYASTDHEILRFRLYDGTEMLNLPVLENIVFESGTSLGTPASPVSLQAGYVIAQIGPDHRVNLSVVDPLWNGSESIRFYARDVGTLNEYSDSTLVNFTVLPDHTPLVFGIPGQSIERGEDFASFDLDEYLTELDGDEISWSVSGNNELQVNIDAEHVASIVQHGGDWIGSESLIFTVTDEGPNFFNSSDTALFTILPIDHAPLVGEIPDQTIGSGGSFIPVVLDEYLTEIDGHDIQWTYIQGEPIQTDPDPMWTVNPADFEFNMTLTSMLSSRGLLVNHANYTLGAFSGETCRGVANPISFEDDWLFFITIYANSDGEEITFRLFDRELEINVPVVERTHFEASNTIGTPASPYLMNAGFLQILIDSNNTASISAMDQTWSGAEEIIFRAEDMRTENQYAGSTAVQFTILEDHVPLVYGIPDQLLPFGADFQSFDLDDYLTELDGDEVIWSVSGQQYHTVNIDNENLVTFIPQGDDWSGSETLIFEVSDVNPNAFSSRDTVLLRIMPPDFPPQLEPIPDQTIGLGGSFQTMNLLDYLINTDGDPVSWSFDYPRAENPISDPGWGTTTSEYEFNMSLTAELSLRGEHSSNPLNTLAAFSDGECRGVAQPVTTGERPLYFLTIYGNAQGEQMEFRVFDQTRMDTLTVHQDLQFENNAIIGSPTNPERLVAQNISIEFISDHEIQPSAANPLWTGTEVVTIYVTDENTIEAYSDSSTIRFTVLSEQTPNVSEIPDQRVMEGESFESIALEEYLQYPEPEEVNWSVSGGIELNFSISENRLLNVDIPDSNWYGEETIELMASNVADPDLYHRQSIQFAVQAINDRPVVASQTYELDEDNSIEISLTATDADSDSLYLSIVIPALHGTYESGFYRPDTNYFGVDSLGYVAFDGELYSDTAMVSISIHPVNDPPEFTSIPILLIEEDDLYIYQMEASDVDSDSLRFRVHALPEWLFMVGGNQLHGFPTNADIGFHQVELSVSDFENPETQVSQNFTVEVIPGLGIGDEGYIPDVYSLSHNFPNPFNPRTTLGYGIPEEGYVSIRIFNIHGQEVRTLLDEYNEAGYRFVEWNGQNDLGQQVPSGFYITVMESGSFREVRKMVMLK